MEGTQGPKGHKYADHSSTVARSRRKLEEQMSAERRQISPESEQRAHSAMKKQFQSYSADRVPVSGKAEETATIAAMRQAIAAERTPAELAERTAAVFASRAAPAA